MLQRRLEMCFGNNVSSTLVKFQEQINTINSRESDNRQMTIVRLPGAPVPNQFTHLSSVLNVWDEKKIIFSLQMGVIVSKIAPWAY